MRIRYFAWIKDITNKDDEIININHPKTIQELKKYLENLYPELKKHFLINLFFYQSLSALSQSSLIS